MAVMQSIGKNLQPFTGNGDVSKWVNECFEKPQTNKKIFNSQQYFQDFD